MEANIMSWCRTLRGYDVPAAQHVDMKQELGFKSGASLVMCLYVFNLSSNCQIGLKERNALQKVKNERASFIFPAAIIFSLLSS